MLRSVIEERWGWKGTSSRNKEKHIKPFQKYINLNSTHFRPKQMYVVGEVTSASFHHHFYPWAFLHFALRCSHCSEILPPEEIIMNIY